MLQGASLTLLSLILWGGWGWSLRPCHWHKLGLKFGLKVDIRICLQARLAFYVCLLVYCSALPFQHFVFVLSCAFPLDLILLIFNTPEMQRKLFYAGAIIFKQEGLFRISNLPSCQEWMSWWYFLLWVCSYAPNHWACQELKFPDKWSMT